MRRAHRHLHHAREHHGEGTGELDAEPALVVDVGEFLSDCANHAVALYTKHAVRLPKITKKQPFFSSSKSIGIIEN